MSEIKIAHASKDENGKIIGGKAGDQTGKEVCIRTYYMHAKGWHMFRFVSAKHANAMAKAMKQAANNNNIGYDQGERLDIMTAIKKYGSLEKIAEPTECDCGTLIRAPIYQATGVDVGNFTTETEAKVLAKSGLFQDKVSVTSSTEICDGDILVTKTKGHTVAAVSGNPRELLEVDGSWGADTTVKSQHVFGTNEDGKISKQPVSCKQYLAMAKTSSWEFKAKDLCKNGSALIRAIQRFLADLGHYTGAIDGWCGKGTIKAMQAFLKAQGFFHGTVNGILNAATVKAWQQYINSRL